VHITQIDICRLEHAVKVDENNVQKAKVYTALALEHDPSLLHAAFTTKLLLDHEVLLMQAFNCHLLFFSAHTDLANLLDNFRRSQAISSSSSADELGVRAWNVVCDAYCTRICLMEPPSTIALAALVLAAKLLKVCLSLSSCDLCSRGGPALSSCLLHATRHAFSVGWQAHGQTFAISMVHGQENHTREPLLSTSN
jgi:hypothetical protein